MQAHEIMISSIYTVQKSDIVRVAIEKFIKYRINGLPVVNEKNQIVAYISDGDIMRYIGKHQNIIYNSLDYIAFIKGDDDNFEKRIQGILDLNIMDIATKKVIKVSWDEEIENVAAILGKRQIKNLPVERNGTLVGIISRGDVIRNSFKAIL